MILFFKHFFNILIFFLKFFLNDRSNKKILLGLIIIITIILQINKNIKKKKFNKIKLILREKLEKLKRKKFLGKKN